MEKGSRVTEWHRNAGMEVGGPVWKIQKKIRKIARPKIVKDAPTDPENEASLLIKTVSDPGARCEIAVSRIPDTCSAWRECYLCRIFCVHPRRESCIPTRRRRRSPLPPHTLSESYS